MVGKRVQKEEIANAISKYLADTAKHPGVESIYDDETDTYLLKDANQKEITIGPGWTCSDDSLKEELSEIMMAARDAEATKSSNLAVKRIDATIIQSNSRYGQDKPQVHSSTQMRDMQVKDLTLQDIAGICPDATDHEAFMFLKLCQARNLNPFVKEAYLVKYDKTKPAQMVVGKDAFTRMAEDHKQFDGYRAGIIISVEGKIQEREGTFLLKGEELLGGWSEISRKDRKLPFKYTVGLAEYNKKQSSWVTMPATMIRKCALVGGLREAFPGTFSGMYDQAEIIEADPTKEILED